MPQSALDVFQPKSAVLEDFRVRLKLDERAVRFFRLAGVLFLQLADLKTRLGELAVAMAAHEKVFRQRIDGFRPDSVEADAELKHLIIVFRAGVDLGNAVHDLAERDAAPVIAHRHVVALDVDGDFLAVAHDVFVNRVVHDLLEQDVAAVVGMRAAADASDIHARAQPDVLQRGQRLDFALVVNWCRFFSHRICAAEKMRQTRKEFNAKASANYSSGVSVSPKASRAPWRTCKT